MRVFLDKIASSTAVCGVRPQVIVGPHIPAVAGAVLAVEVLDEKSTYNQLEDPNGRMRTVHAGDKLAVVLGQRKALRGYTGVVPSRVKPGDILHLLNLGGVVGQCVSYAPEVGPPARVRVIGAILSFEDRGCTAGLPTSIFPGQIALQHTLNPLPPTVLVAGTCMHAGKTAAACTLVRQFTKRGLRVGVAKVTGVALRRDVLEMVDHGAVKAVTFADAGLPSTLDDRTVPAAFGALNEVAASGVDVLLVELGDGLLGDYGVRDLLCEPQLRAATSAVVLAATDPVAAWGGHQLLQNMGYNTDVITGPATDNAAGNSSIAAHTGCAAFNARTAPTDLAQCVLEALGLQAEAPVAAMERVS